jgi:hypothetical protein
MNDNDNIYFNIKRSFNKQSTFDFAETRVSNVLQNPSDYQLAITRFSIPSIGIPILFDVPNKYSITLKFNNSVETVDLSFSSDTTPLYSPYLAVWSYNDIVQGMNNGLKQLHDDMKITQPTFPPTKECSMVFDPITQLFSIYAQSSYASANIELFFHSELYSLFNSFQAINTTLGFFPIFQTLYRIIIKDNGNNGTTYGGGGYIMTQNFKTISQMNTFQSLIFETNSIPIHPELLGTQTNESRIIIDDFIIERETDNRLNINYYPTGPLLFTDLTSQQPLRNIDLKVSWTTSEGQTFPLITDESTPLDIKLLFRKKLNQRLEEVYTNM